MQQVKQARLLKAEETFREALALSQGPGGRRFPNAGYPLAKLGELACEWNDWSKPVAMRMMGWNFVLSWATLT